MKIVKQISLTELKTMSDNMYGNIVKADIDVDKNIVIVDMPLHADGEAELLRIGSMQDSLWGINLHPDKYKTDDFVEFDSMINIRPKQNNYSRDIADENIKNKIRQIISETVYE